MLEKMKENSGGSVMAIDYPSLADFLRDELHQFLRIMRQPEPAETRDAAVEQLWMAVKRVEAFSYAPSEEQWNILSESQRWGYLRLESYIGTVVHELRQLQRTVWQSPNRYPQVGAMSEEAFHTKNVESSSLETADQSAFSGVSL